MKSAQLKRPPCLPPIRGTLPEKAPSDPGVNSYPVVIYKHIAEDDGLYLLSCHFVSGYPIYLLFLECCKKAFHPSIVEAVSGSAETLNHSVLAQFFLTCFTGILTAPVAVDNGSFQIRILLGKLSDCVYTQFLLHVIVHLQCHYFTVKTVHDRRNIQLAVEALNLRYIRQKLAHRLFRIKIPLYQVFFLLYFGCRFGYPVRSMPFMQKTILFHRTVYRAPADMDSSLP